MKVFIWRIEHWHCSEIGIVEAEDAADAKRKVAIRRLGATKEEFAASKYGVRAWERLVLSWGERIEVRGPDDGDGIFIDTPEDD